MADSTLPRNRRIFDMGSSFNSPRLQHYKGLLLQYQAGMLTRDELIRRTVDFKEPPEPPSWGEVFSDAVRGTTPTSVDYPSSDFAKIQVSPGDYRVRVKEDE